MYGRTYINIPVTTLLVILSFSVLGQKLKQVTYDSIREYQINNEDSLMNLWGNGSGSDEYELVNADLHITHTFGPSDINFLKAKLNGDTLNLDFHGYPGHTFESFSIIVIKDQYRINFNFIDDTGFASKMISKESKLVLNTGDLMKGGVVRGYVEYNGKVHQL